MHVVKRTTLARKSDAGYLLITSCIASRAVLWQDVALLIPFPKLGIDTNPNTASTGRPLLPIHCRSPLLLVRPAALHPRGDAFYRALSIMRRWRASHARVERSTVPKPPRNTPGTKRAAFPFARKAALALIPHSQPQSCGID